MCVPGVIGSTAGSNPVGQGSSPWGHALSEPSLARWAYRPTGRCRRRMPEIRVRFPVSPLNFSPVVQRLRRLVHIQETMVQFHPGLLAKQWLGRQLADHFGLEPEMLWVRIPPELLMEITVT